jgi:ribosomal protein S12 methylthiotransferase accessory factor
MDMIISFPGGKQVQADIQGVKILTDQPAKAGGTGEHPSPFLLFLASLGTCAGYYVLSFCQNKGISTEGIQLVQRHEYVQLGQGKTQLSKIIIEIQVPQDFPQQYREVLIRVADQCAVKKTIALPPPIEVKTIVT